MRCVRGMILAAAAMVMLSSAAARAADGVEIDCKETDLQFEASGFEVKCKDYSQSTIALSELSAASRTYTLFAVSDAELTFLHVFSNYVRGGTRIYMHRRSIEKEVEDNFEARFSDWASAEDVGDYEVKRMTAVFEGDDPLECLAFRKLGARRGEGVSGMTVGFTCSAGGRDQAMAALKNFAG
jgi:hypothetical protein